MAGFAANVSSYRYGQASRHNPLPTINVLSEASIILKLVKVRTCSAPKNPSKKGLFRPLFKLVGSFGAAPRLFLVAQYYAALKFAAESALRSGSRSRRVYLMPLGGGKRLGHKLWPRLFAQNEAVFMVKLLQIRNLSTVQTQTIGQNSEHHGFDKIS